MIPIARGAEPDCLGQVRAEQLALLRGLGRAPNSNDVKGYRVVADDLWKCQYHKCCYCEHRIMKAFHDVEHYRPKARVDRRPGCGLTHGYWWLAFSWDNLLYACPGCNRSGKNDRFPMEHGAVSLEAESFPPGGELPLLIDPASGVNPVEHVEFVQQSVGPTGSPKYWWARPRNGSRFGNMTIDVCDLNRSELREIRNDHFEMIVAPQVKALNDALAKSSRAAVNRALARALDLLKPRNVYVACTYDALRANVPDARLHDAVQKGWPSPKQIGLEIDRTGLNGRCR